MIPVLTLASPMARWLLMERYIYILGYLTDAFTFSFSIVVSYAHTNSTIKTSWKTAILHSGMFGVEYP